jgi:antitoxin CptB
MPTRMTVNAPVPPMPNDRAAIERLRRKLGFRAWHRGTSEADLLIGTFADRSLTWFAAEELYQFERLLEEDDPVIDDWVTGRQLVPKEHDNRVLNLLRRFYVAISTSPPHGSAPRSPGSSRVMEKRVVLADSHVGGLPCGPDHQAEWREG